MSAPLFVVLCWLLLAPRVVASSGLAEPYDAFLTRAACGLHSSGDHTAQSALTKPGSRGQYLERTPAPEVPRRSSWIDLMWPLALLTVLAFLVGVAYRRRRDSLPGVEDLRLRIAIDLHDDIGSDLGSIALMADLVGRSQCLAESDRLQLQRIGDLARQTSDKLREIVWLVDPEHDSVGDLVNRMRLFASVILKDLDVRWDVSDELSAAHLHLPAKRDIIMVFKEVLHNIARHARASVVSVKLYRIGPFLHMEISDDGIGFSPIVRNGGTGIRNMNGRAAAHSGRCVVWSSPGSGTRVHFSARVAQTRASRRPERKFRFRHRRRRRPHRVVTGGPGQMGQLRNTLGLVANART